MTCKKILLASVAIIAAMTSIPASATSILFELKGAKTATFTIDSDRVPDFLSSSFIGDQVSYNSVSGIFGGEAASAFVGFGTFLAAQLNIGGTVLGFTQYGGDDLFSLVADKPVFKLGTFNLNSITSGAATITISEATAAVPEPASWALMLAGFGGIGFAMRSRRSRVSRSSVRFA